MEIVTNQLAALRAEADDDDGEGCTLIHHDVLDRLLYICYDTMRDKQQNIVAADVGLLLLLAEVSELLDD